jgi:large subunit ribosomal protein L18
MFYLNSSIKRRKRRVRAKIASRSNTRRRLSLFFSNKHIYAQVIDDSLGRTLVSASTLEGGEFESLSSKSCKDAASLVGKVIAQKALKADIKQVVFDRGAMLYHGKVSCLADSARKYGLDF